MPKCEILFGQICSGKSTYSKKRAREGAIIISDDAILYALHGGDYQLYDKTLKPLYKGLEMSIFSLAVAHGKDIVIDRPNISINSRKRYVGMAKSLDIDDIACVIFPRSRPEIHAKRRFEANNRGRTLDSWIEAALYFHNKLEEPTLSEGFSRFIDVMWD